MENILDIEKSGNNSLKAVNKIKIIILFLIFYLPSFSQNLESIKNLDTVYIYFNYGKYETKSKFTHSKEEKNFFKNMLTYEFSLDFYNTVNFRYNDYKDFDAYEKGIKVDVKMVKKRFLRKNKEKILDINFFLKEGFLKTFNALYVPKKVIYLIDSKEIKGRNVILKEVTMDAPSFTPE